MLGVLLAILKVLGILLLVLLALVAAALLLPLTAYLDYSGGQFRAAAGTCGLRFQLYPAKPGKKAKPKKPKAKKKKAEAAQPKKPKAEGDKPAKKKQLIRLGVDTICAMVQQAGWLLGKILGSLKIHGVRVHLPIHGKDAADTAVQYGNTNAYIHSALGVLHNGLHIQIDELAIVPDFNDVHKGQELFSCKITARLIIIVAAGIRALWQLFKAGVFGAHT